MNDYQALADIRRNKDAVKSLLDKYGRHRYFRLQRQDDLEQYQRRNSLRVFDVDVVEKDVRSLTLLYLLTLLF